MSRGGKNPPEKERKPKKLSKTGKKQRTNRENTVQYGVLTLEIQENTKKKMIQFLKIVILIKKEKIVMMKLFQKKCQIENTYQKMNKKL